MATSQKTQLLLAAPANILASSLRTFLGTIAAIELVGSADRVDQIAYLLNNCSPDILLLDADLMDQQPGLNPITFLDELCLASSHTTIILLAGNLRQQHASPSGGKVRVLLKGELGGQLRQAIQNHAGCPLDFN